MAEYSIMPKKKDRNSLEKSKIRMEKRLQLCYTV